MIKHIIQTLLEVWQVWCRDHSPGEPVPVTDHLLSEEPSPNVQTYYLILLYYFLRVKFCTFHGLESFNQNCTLM